MITSKQFEYKRLSGMYEGYIVAVEVQPNQGNPKWENFTENVLEVSFQLEDPVTKDPVMFTQKFVAPLTGVGLYQQMLDALGEKPDANGNFDEQKFVGMPVVVQMGVNKKGFNRVDQLERLKGKEFDTSLKRESFDEDTPDFLKDVPPIS
jgi:hypothetical protein